MKRRVQMPLWYSLLALVVSMVLTAAVAVVIADRAARQSERRWCGIVTTLDDTYRATPPTTPTGRRQAAEIAKLRADFGCPPPLRD